MRTARVGTGAPPVEMRKAKEITSVLAVSKGVHLTYRAKLALKLTSHIANIKRGEATAITACKGKNLFHGY